MMRASARMKSLGERTFDHQEDDHVYRSHSVCTSAFSKDYKEDIVHYISATCLS